MLVKPKPGASLYQREPREKEKSYSIFGRNQQGEEKRAVNTSCEGPASSQAGNKCWWDGGKKV